MFNDSFYPTPFDLIERMIAPLSVEIGYQRYIPHVRGFLEPSAGKGDILDYLVKYRGLAKEAAYAIELDDNLAKIIQGKGYTVVDRDFLTYSDYTPVNLIVMNPPFDQGAKHALKAWNVLSGSHARMVCLLNAETLRNPYTQERQTLVKLIEQHGRVEYVQNAFRQSERSTGVEVAIVWLNKPYDDPFAGINAGAFQKDGMADEPIFTETRLANTDLLTALVDQYNEAASLLGKRAEINAKLKDLIRSIDPTLSSSNDYEERKEAKTLGEEIIELKRKFWRYVFDRTKIGQNTTSGFREKFNQMFEDNRFMSFSIENIVRVLDMFMEGREDIMKQCVVSTFDTAVAFHKDNWTGEEGFKTNASWKVNKKLIIPGMVDLFVGWSLDYRKKPFFDDIDKVLCWLTGEKFRPEISTVKAIEARFNILNEQRRGNVTGLAHLDYAYPIDTHFFTIRVYQKGTAHITFKNLEHLRLFNESAAKCRTGLGDGHHGPKNWRVA